MTNTEIVQSIYAGFGRRDMAAIAALCTSDLEIRQTPLLPWGGVHRGLKGLGDFFALLAENVETVPAFSHFIEAGDDVVAVGRLTGTARKTGKPIDIAIAHVWTVIDDKATGFHAYIDTPAMLSALAR